jgi:hypothetical protein
MAQYSCNATTKNTASPLFARALAVSSVQYAVNNLQSANFSIDWISNELVVVLE